MEVTIISLVESLAMTLHRGTVHSKHEATRGFEDAAMQRVATQAGPGADVVTTLRAEGP